MTATVERMLGQQSPRVMSVPPYSVSLGDEAIDFAAKAGLYLDPWQQMVLRESLGMAPGGKWTAPQVGLLVPRQNGKGSVLEARELFGLFVLGEELIIHSAHKFDTSQEHFLRMRNLIDGNPDLSRHVKSVLTANGKESITLRNGHRLKFKARTISGSGRGFSGDLLVLDEAMLLPEQALDAMMPTLITRKNPQTWFTSSAGTADSAALWRIVKRGRDGAPRLAYFEWGCPTGVDVLDRANWAAANPGLGHRISLEALEDDLAQMSEEGFAREHLGIWDDVARQTVIPLDVWDAAADPSGEIAGSIALAVDVAPDRSSASIALAGLRIDGKPQVEVVQMGPGAAWVVPRLVELTSAHQPLAVVVDPGSPAGSLLPALAEAGLDVTLTTTREVGQAFGAFVDAAMAGEVRHLADPALADALAGAKKRALGEAWAWDRKNYDTNITPLVAVTLALWGLNAKQVKPFNVDLAVW